MALADPTLTMLYSFSATDNGGAGPSGGLVVEESTGVVYVTTDSYGEFNGGTMVSLTPPVAPSTTWTPSVLHAFGGTANDGKGPEGRLLADFDSNGHVTALYGATVFGPSLVYKLVPPTRGTDWRESFLHVYKCCRDAVTSYDGVIRDEQGLAGPKGALYGVTSQGGGTDPACFGGCGTVYRLLPPVAPAVRWTREILYRFRGGAKGWNPVDGLVMNSDGVLYGTANGGINNNGLVFSLSPANWAYHIVYSFQDNGDGAIPTGSLSIIDGELYGTTGAHSGAVYKISIPVPPATRARPKTLYHFLGFDDGNSPSGPPLPGPDGTLYGMTFAGGQANCGTIYQLTPPVRTRGPWTKTILHDFADQPNDGCNPGNYGLVATGDGALYGTTSSGGEHNAGTVFKLVP